MTASRAATPSSRDPVPKHREIWGTCRSHAASGPRLSPDMRAVSQEAQARLRKPSPRCGGRPGREQEGRRPPCWVPPPRGPGACRPA